MSQIHIAYRVSDLVESEIVDCENNTNFVASIEAILSFVLQLGF